MRKKIFGIFACIILITVTAIPVIGIDNSNFDCGCSNDKDLIKDDSEWGFPVICTLLYFAFITIARLTIFPFILYFITTLAEELNCDWITWN